MRAYGIELRGTAKISNININSKIQSKILSRILNPPSYVSNETIRKDLRTFLQQNRFAVSDNKNFHRHFNNHQNTQINETSSLTLAGNPPRRLKRTRCKDVCIQ